MMKAEEFNKILEKCNTINGSGREIFSLQELEDEDLVCLYDTAPDYSYIFETEDGYWNLASLTMDRAGVEDIEGTPIEEVYEKAVEILRKRQ